MESRPTQNTADDSYDYLIAFFVIAGALAFIILQSFPTNLPVSNHKSGASSLSAIPTSKKKVSSTKTKSATTDYYQQKQEVNKYQEDRLQEWTNDLDKQEVRNTPFRVPAPTTTAAVGTMPLAVSPPKDSITSIPVEKAVTSTPIDPSVGTTTVKDKALFIDTNVKKKNTAKAITNNKTVLEEKPIAKKEIITKTLKEQPVENYEVVSPVISSQQEVQQKTTTSKKVAEPSCIIMIAALKDKVNINRLIQSLKKEKYEVYNKISGKYRTIGVRTSCDPTINKPALRAIKKKYSDTAFLLKR